MLGPNSETKVTAATAVLDGVAIDEELAAGCAAAFGLGVYGPWRVAGTSDGTCSQLRPVEATEGARDATSVCNIASVTWKEPSVELVDGARGAAAASARFPSPTLPPEARGIPA